MIDHDDGKTLELPPLPEAPRRPVAWADVAIDVFAYVVTAIVFGAVIYAGLTCR